MYISACPSRQLPRDYYFKTTYLEGIESLLGGVFCFVSLFLIVIGPSRHRRFALLISGVGKNFRILGLLAIVCGVGLVYLVLV